MAQRDLVISFLSGVPNWMLSKFRNRPLMIQGDETLCNQQVGRAGYQQWLSKYMSYTGSGRDRKRYIVPGLFRAAGGRSTDTIGRVCVMGFSNGCIGVSEVLMCDDWPQIDCVLAIDGIHGEYKDPKEHLQYPERYFSFIRYGLNTAKKNPEDSANYPVCIITHSSIVPPYVSTTETAEYIWQAVSGRIPSGIKVETEFCGYPDCVTRQRLARLEAIQYDPCVTPPRNGCCGVSGQSCRSSQGDGVITFTGLNDGWWEKHIANNFHVFGWKNKGRTGYPDHLYQAERVLPAMVQEFLIGRWGGDCPGAVTGFGLFGNTDPAGSCPVPQGQVYGEGEEQDNNVPGMKAPQNYFPGLTPGRIPPGIHPKLPDPEGSVPDESSSFPLVSVVTGLSGLAAGYFGARYFLKGRKHV